MKYISLPSIEIRELPFYLAMEEYVARNLDEESAFFMWQVSPSVIFGRNQLIETEVNIPYCKRQGIRMYRRKSGGGCVYADMNNIMFSYITKDENVRLTFDSYIDMIVKMLQSLNVDAEGTGRNDILIKGKKVSGNAFYHVPGKSIVHGTMLFDTDMDNMIQAITPSRAKIKSKGIESVRNRITTLKEYLDIDIQTFKNYVKKFLCDDELCLDDDAISKINEIEKDYLTDDFIYSNNPCSEIMQKFRHENVGEIEVQIELKHNAIKRINLLGDYFLLGDIDKKVLLPLAGCPYNRESVKKVLSNVKMEDIILNLSNEQFLQLLF